MTELALYFLFPRQVDYFPGNDFERTRIGIDHIIHRFYIFNLHRFLQGFQHLPVLFKKHSRHLRFFRFFKAADHEMAEGTLAETGIVDGDVFSGQ